MSSGVGPLESVSSLLGENNVEDWDSRVLYQLLEFQYRTTKELLNQGYTYARHRGSSTLNDKDIKLALEFDKSVNARPTPTQNQAARLNNTALPPIRPNFLRLPRNAFVHDECFSELIEEEQEEVEQAPPDGPVPCLKPSSVGRYNVKRRKTKLQFRTPQPKPGFDT